MPVNSFENYILTWKPDREKLKYPIYTSLAELMEKDIASGVLPVGTKLPPQRELADYLDVSLNTITRAYTLCEKRGLLYAVTGKGTFVNSSINSIKSVVETNTEKNIINVGITVSPQPNIKQLKLIINEITQDKSFADNIRFANPASTDYQLHAARKWLDNFNIKSTGEILITNGSQNSLTLILAGIFEAGDRIIVDQYTYPNFLALANMLHIVLLTVPSDEYGMDVAELKKILNTNNVKGIYLSPSCSNPQATCMPLNRRKEIAELIDGYNLILIEDDCYAFLIENKPQPIYNMVSDNAIYLTELNKAISPGIKTGYICYDEKFRSKLEQANYNCNLTVDWFSAQIAAHAINSCVYEKSLAEHILLTQKRNEIYAKYFPVSNMNSYYQWLELPQGISSVAFESVALKAGVKVYGSERFLTGDAGGRYFLRVSTSGPDTYQDLEKALTTIKQIIDDIRNQATDINYTV
ncbi:MAG: PLP-dependent aminotransferase family protein [Oscillospiraceae bacterium]|nr:PLP-dependent aminotransferase family protein [Oscillospiraceae bacterium]